MMRKRVSGRRDRRMFSKTADRVNYKNIAPVPMRGGIRL